MNKLTIKLNQTNKAQFCEWLNDYTKKIGGINSVDYPFTGGAVFCILYHDIFQVSKTSFSARIKQRPLGGEPPPGVVAINIYDPDENVTYSFWEWDMDNALGLHWLEVEGGLKVTINHEGAKWVIPPLFQLLAAIKADYPSASDDINRYIVEKAEWWGFNLPYSLENKLAMTYIITEQAQDEINKKANQSIERDAPQPARIGEENITLSELEKLEIAAEAGDIKAQKRLAEIKGQEWYKELEKKLIEIARTMRNYVDGLFDNHPSKPVFEMIKSLRHSEDPVHRATAGLFGKLSLAEIQDHGAKLLADELLKSAKKLPPINIAKVGAKKPEKQEPKWRAILEQANFEDSTGWDMLLIQMWNDGYSCVDVAKRACVSIERAQNRKSEIRRILGRDNGYLVLPTDKDRKAQLTKSRYTA